MTARGRANSTADWDPMADDYNNSSFDAQYADNDARGRVMLDHSKLYITNLPRGLSEEGLRTAFEKYGQVEACFISNNPQKKFALISFETAAEARIAMMKLNKTGPLNLVINIAHKKPNRNATDQRKDDDSQRTSKNQLHNRSNREHSGSVTSRRSRNLEDPAAEESLEYQLTEDMGIDIDRELHIELESIKLEKLKLKEEQLMCKQKMLLLQQNEKRLISNPNTASGSSRRILPDGRIIIQSVPDKSQETDTSYTAGAGDSNETTCSCQKSWRQETEGSSTPSTCIVCSDERSATLSKKNTPDKSETSKCTDVKTSQFSSRAVESKTTDITVSKANYKAECSKIDGSKLSDATSKKCEARKCACKVKSDATCDIKFRDFYSDSDNEADETNRLIQLRNSDYLDVVDDELKLVIALAGYPNSKMRLKQMEHFQRCLTDVINMQVKANLLKKVPSFFDYYLNRGAIVCVCKDLETRDWMVRISPGLQERMCTNLVLLNSKVKRLCLAVLKIPRACWPATAQDCFKLLQYFNPSLRTSSWKIYAQKIIDDVECTSFLIDRVSGEIIRGPTFKNIIDYEQMEFELTGYTEIYYECLLSGIDEDLSSVASRVKLLEEIKSAHTTPRIASTVSIKSIEHKTIQVEEIIDNPSITEITQKEDEDKFENEEPNMKKELEMTLDDDVRKKIKNVQYIGDNDEVLIWADETSTQPQNESEDKPTDNSIGDNNTTTTSLVAMSEKSESVIESTDNLLIKSSTINIDSNRGIAYHRRTNYLHVENELKVAITLEGYPQNKLEGTHIRRLKHLFKEYLHKDMKSQRFANMIIPKFQDIYLSNGAVIYICDSLETKDYLTDVLPKFINSTGLKLTFRDVTNLVRYTRIVMRLPKEQAHYESIEILSKLQEKYPALKPDCWKYYSDVAGKQKRQFGVDPESLDVIKSPDFDPVFEGEKLIFRIIDRQKRDLSCEESNKNEVTEDVESKRQRHAIVKNMYTPIDQEITNLPLTRIRTNHYSDLIADDWKLYVGPVNYPDSRIDEPLFHSIKRTFENIVIESFDKGELSEDTIPKIHDMYLFDGVIFFICQNMDSRIWIEMHVAKVNEMLKIKLKSTEFRGAVGIISMVAKTNLDTDEVIEILQQQNPRLRTKYWRKISTVQTSTKLDVVLQIDKLSAQVITDPNFNSLVGNEPVLFKLGHLQSLIKPKSSLEELTKAHVQKLEKKLNKAVKLAKKRSRRDTTPDIVEAIIDNRDVGDNEKDKESEDDLGESPKLKQDQIQKERLSDSELDMIIHPSNRKFNKEIALADGNYQMKVILKIPLHIMPENEDDLFIIFDILEDKNPGLNTEIWQVYSEAAYPSNGKFIIYVDKQSLSIIQSKEFDPCVGGEKLMFYF